MGWFSVMVLALRRWPLAWPSLRLIVVLFPPVLLISQHHSPASFRSCSPFPIRVVRILHRLVSAYYSVSSLTTGPPFLPVL